MHCRADILLVPSWIFFLKNWRDLDSWKEISRDREISCKKSEMSCESHWEENVSLEDGKQVTTLLSTFTGVFKVMAYCLFFSPPSFIYFPLLSFAIVIFDVYKKVWSQSYKQHLETEVKIPFSSQYFPRNPSAHAQWYSSSSYFATQVPLFMQGSLEQGVCFTVNYK